MGLEYCNIVRNLNCPHFLNGRAEFEDWGFLYGRRLTNTGMASTDWPRCYPALKAIPIHSDGPQLLKANHALPARPRQRGKRGVSGRVV